MEGSAIWCSISASPTERAPVPCSRRWLSAWPEPVPSAIAVGRVTMMGDANAAPADACAVMADSATCPAANARGAGAGRGERQRRACNRRRGSNHQFTFPSRFPRQASRLDAIPRAQQIVRPEWRGADASVRHAYPPVDVLRVLDRRGLRQRRERGDADRRGCGIFERKDQSRRNGERRPPNIVSPFGYWPPC